jgi:hypothetical protein
MTRAPRHPLRRALVLAVLVVTTLAAGCGSTAPGQRPVADLGSYDASAESALARIDPAATTVGLADSDLLGLSADEVGPTVARMSADGVTDIRILIPWAAVQHTQGTYDWALVDRLVESAVAQRMSVLATLNSTPEWAVPPGEPAIHGRPASADAFGTFAAAVAQHFRGKVSAYEIWNEPNAAAFFAPTPNPAQFVDLLKAAYPAIKRSDPAALVVTGGLGPIVDFAPITMDAVKFVKAMYAAGAKDYFDAIGYHPYQYTMKFSEGGYHPDSPINQLAGIRALMLANGDGDKKIWATEYGEPSSVVGEASQAEYLDDMLGKWRLLPYAGPVYVYTMRDRDSASSHGDDTLGLYRSDGTAKPGLQVFTSHIANHGTPVRQVNSVSAGASAPR